MQFDYKSWLNCEGTIFIKFGDRFSQHPAIKLADIFICNYIIKFKSIKKKQIVNILDTK